LTDRPTERDLELDAIDDDFKKAVGGFATILHTYGISPLDTFEKAHAMASQGLVKARRARLAMIAMLDTLVIVLLIASPVYADNSPFSGARSVNVSMHRAHRVHHPKWCVRNWNYDYDQKVPIRCKDR
jgi:hypothetical protein